MTIKQAGDIEIARMAQYIIPPHIREDCNLCGAHTELRAGVCWACVDKAETDMQEVWEIRNPAHRWPYVWSAGHKVVHDTFNG
jgi:predicted amidophosphoribosyltransferase